MKGRPVRYSVGRCWFVLGLIGAFGFALLTSIQSGEFGVSTSSWLGGSGEQDRVEGVRIQSDGTIVISANLSDAAPGGLPPLILGDATSSSGGAIVRLSSDGRTVLSVTRLCAEISEIELDPQDNIHVAAGSEGIFKLTPTADSILWQSLNDLAGIEAHRLDVSHDGADPLDHGYIAVLSPGTDEVYGKAGRGTIYLLDPSGTLLNQFPGRDQHCQDVAIHSGERIIIGIGYSNLSTWTTDLGDSTPVDVPWMNAWSWDHVQGVSSHTWAAYGWSGDPWLRQNGELVYDHERDSEGELVLDGNGAPVALPWRDETGSLILDENGETIPRRIPNPRWINYPFDPNRIRILSDGRIRPDTMSSNMADTRGNRVAIGADGNLYALFEFDGGNTPMRSEAHSLGSIIYEENADPNNRTVASWSSSSVPFSGGGDPYSALYNTSTVPKVFYLKYEVSTGDVLNSSALVNRLGSGDDNTVRSRYGDLAADKNGRLYLGGDSAYGLPILFNNDEVPRSGEATFNPFGPDSYTGGAWFLAVSPDFTTREYLTRLSVDSRTVAVDARILEGQTEATIAWGGENENTSLFFREEPIQSTAGVGNSQGFFAVLGGDVGGEPISATAQIDWLASGESSGTSKLRDTDPEIVDNIDLDGDGENDDQHYRYPFRTDISLNPESTYTGPVFKGGLEARVYDYASHTFRAEVTYNRLFSFRSQPGGGSRASQHGVWFIEKDQFNNVAPGQTLSFGADSFLKIQDQFPVTAYRWLVRQDGNFYVSEDLVGSDAMLSFSSDTEDGNWAVLNFDGDGGSGMNFDAEAATFESRNFSDIDAVGFVLDKDEISTSRFFQRINRFVAVLAPDLEENHTPVASFTVAPKTLARGQEASMQSLSTDPEGEIDALIWDFGDGNSAGGPLAVHSWNEPGTFTIRHTIRDAEMVTDRVEDSVVVTTARPTTLPSTTIAVWGGLFRSGSNLWPVASTELLDLDGDGQVDDRREVRPYDSASAGNQIGRVPFHAAWVGENLDATATTGRVRPRRSSNSGGDRFDLRYQPGGGDVRLHGLFWFEKENFFNGRDNESLGATFAPEDVMGFEQIIRLEGLDVRWAVRDGEIWYLSEVNDATSLNLDGMNQWAPFSPDITLNFDQASAVYEPGNFRDISAVGFYLEQDEFGVTNRLWLNFLNFEVQSTGDPTTGYDLWALHNFPANVVSDPTLEATVWGRSADPNRDGVQNEFARLLGRGPYESTRGPVSSQRVDAGVFEVDFEYLADLEDIDLVVEWSHDLETWSEDEVTEAGSELLENGLTRFTYRFSQSVAAETFFVRLRAVPPVAE